MILSSSSLNKNYNVMIKVMFVSSTQVRRLRLRLCFSLNFVCFIDAGTCVCVCGQTQRPASDAEKISGRDLNFASNKPIYHFALNQNH